jgi:regulator of RNase E activity RraA
MRMMSSESIEERDRMNFEPLKQKLLSLDTACVCDSDKKIRTMDPGIHPINQGLKMAGIARTVRCQSDFLSVIKALHDATENDVLVVEAGAKNVAVAGELFTAEAQRKGLGGIVIDGGCRDIGQLKQMNFPVYTRFVTPRAGSVQQISQTQIPIMCGGVTVSPGDIVFGDDDGIIVTTQQECAEIIDIALNIQEKEEKVQEMLAENQSLIDLMNFSEHYDKIGRGEESQLVFLV